MNKEKALVVSKEDLSLVKNNSLNQNQLGQLLKKTPEKYIKERPAKGGGKWKYVSGGYVKKCLNLMFGWDWDFEIVDEQILIESKEVVVKGRLTCRTVDDNGNSRQIIKMQYGNKDIIFKTEKVFDNGKPVMIEKYGRQVQETRPTDEPLSIGNDMKAAATDALKKCASEIGIAADIYNADEFREIKIQEPVSIEELQGLYDLKKEQVSPEDQIHIERIIETKEIASYNKVFTKLQSL